MQIPAVTIMEIKVKKCNLTVLDECEEKKLE